jgi:crotonobetaine/carnitine-CoA ligase|tara:strand:- start:19605 stop:21191 length:1587 start_codon:yes stop_codon:yes gene_type:complete
MREPSPIILADIIAAKAESKPDLDILTFEGGGVRDDEIRTYQTLWENGNRIAAGLIARGMEPGDRFALILRNHPEFVDAMVGTSISACAFVPIDPRTRGDKLAYTMHNSGCKGAIIADYAVHFLSEIQARVPTLEWVWVLETDEETAMPWTEVKGAETLGAIYAEPYTTGHDRLTGPEDLFEIMYTSGTTGDPKGVVCRNGRYGIVAQARQGVDIRPYTGLSLTHGNAQMITLGMTIGGDTRSVFSRKFTKSRLWDITRKYGCTMFNLLGGMATAIYAEPERDNDGDNPVQFVLSAGMPIAIWEAFEKRFNVAIAEGYGAVEGGSSSKPIGVGPIGSIGKPPEHLEIRIVDEDDNDCPIGVPGELISRPRTGPQPKVEYWGNPDASDDKTRGGWLRSGDICHLDEEGWLFFDFRKGGGIRRNGDFISPGFVEGVVAASDQVVDVFVYGVPAASGAPGEKDVVAAIVPHDRATFNPVAVFSKCRKDLEPNFVPSFLQLVAEIPKTASEKPQERFLLERFDAGDDEIFSE